MRQRSARSRGVNEDGGHAQSVGGRQIAGQIFEKRSGVGFEAELFQHAGINVGMGLGNIIRRDNIKNIVKQMQNPQLTGDPFRMGPRPIGENKFAPWQAINRPSQFRIGR